MNRHIRTQRLETSRPSSDPQREFRSRLRVVLSSIALLAAAVLGKLVYVQIFLHADLTDRARTQYQKSVYLAPTRGVIYDRRGRELAANVESFSVYGEPAVVEDRAGTARRLATELDLPEDRLYKQLARGKGFVWLKRQISPREEKALRTLDLPGIGLSAESRRFYPHRELASQVIGFAGIDSQGLEGIEYSFDQYLRGDAGWLAVQRDALNRAVFVEGFQSDPANRGQDIVLTLDQNIQHFAQEEIRRAVAAAGAREGMVMVMDPRTGEMLALAVASDFNPNERQGIRDGRWRNICLTDVFEPGSTMKPFVVAGALEEKKVTPEKIFYCGNGSIDIYDKTIKDVHPYGDLTVSQVVAKSSNVGAIRIGQTLNRERFYHWLTAFGFGQETGVDLPGECRGLLRPPGSWSGLSQPSLSIGQEIGVTPLQMLAGYATLANGGLYYRPRVVGAVQRDGLPVKFFPAEEVRRVVTPETARRIGEMLRLAVTEGTGKAAAIPGYTVAGKTGTAQKYGTGGYSANKYLSSFIGFAPVENPAVVILVMVDEPVGAYYGGSVAAPVFAAVGERTLRYLAVPHDDLEGLRKMVEKRTRDGRAG